METQNQQSDEKKYNYFYKITNLVNGKYYYGIHSTNRLKDGYMGGGHILKKAIKKHGTKNFIKEIIADYPTRKEASDHEKRVVTKELIELDECYNCRTGGYNEYTFNHTEESKKKMSESTAGENHPFFGKTGKDSPYFGRKHTEETKKIISESKIGKPRSEETKRKHSLSRKGKYCGQDNPMFGRKGENNPNFGKTPTDETKKIMRTNAARNKPCLILGIFYFSASEAARQLEMNSETVRDRLNSKSNKFKDWQYC